MQANILEAQLLQEAAELRSLFDWEAWAIGFVGGEAPMAPGAHDDSDADGDSMDIDEAGPAALEDQPKKKRFRYSLAEKIRLLNTILPLK